MPAATRGGPAAPLLLPARHAHGALPLAITAAAVVLAALHARPADALPEEILRNFPVATAEAEGWTKCYQDTFSDSGQSLSYIFDVKCTKKFLLWGCRPGWRPDQWNVAAWGNRNILLVDVGSQQNPQSQVANGATFYYSSSYSYGFVKQGEFLSRNSCDTAQSYPETRMCVHTGGGSINGGYRCGTDFDYGWTREV